MILTLMLFTAIDFGMAAATDNQVVRGPLVGAGVFSALVVAFSQWGPGDE